MKFQNIAPIALGFAALAGSLLLFFVEPCIEREADNAFSIGTEDDPSARANWEFERLRNPQTGVIPRGIRSAELAFAERLPTKESYALYKSSANSLQSSTWLMRGPDVIGGRTRAILFDISDENIILAGGVHGGMWRSTDRGTSWVKTGTPGLVQNVTCLTQDLREGKRNVWYYGTGEQLGTGARPTRDLQDIGDGVYKSMDGGRSWAALPSTVNNSAQDFNSPFEGVCNIAVDPSNMNEDEVYVAGMGAIMRSTDGGASWTKVLGGTPTGQSYFTDVAVTSKGVVYAAIAKKNYAGGTNTAETGLFRSTDGLTWTAITSATFSANQYRTVLSIAPSDENTVFFLTATNQSGGSHSFYKYTYLSGDGSGDGGKWDNYTTNLPSMSSQAGGYDLVLKIKPDDPKTIIIGGTNLFRSTTGSVASGSFVKIGGYSISGTGTILEPEKQMYPNHHPDQHTVAFSYKNPNVMLSGNDGGIYLTENVMDLGTPPAVKWKSLNNGYVNGQFYGVAIDPYGMKDEFLIGGLQDNGTAAVKGFGNSWRMIAGADGMIAAVDSGKASVYFSYQSGNVFRGLIEMQNNLVVVTQATMVKPSGASGFAFVAPFTLDPADGKVMYIPGGSRLWRNSDLTKIPMGNLTSGTAVNWVQVANFTSATLTSVEVCKTPRHRVYVGTSTGKAYRLDNAVSATSAVITPLSSSLFPSSGYINSISADPANGNKALLAFSNYGVRSLFYTTDGGTTWDDVSGNLEENPDGSGNGPACKWVEIVNIKGKLLYFVGTTVGLFSTTELKGSSTVWVREGANSIGRVPVDMVVARESDGFVAVATHGNGIFTTYLDVPASGVESAEQSTLMLLENYPNPFYDRTMIRFALAHDEFITISLHDLSGRQVAHIASGRYGAGDHTADFGGRTLQSGTYFCRITSAGGQSTTRKITVVR